MPKVASVLTTDLAHAVYSGDVLESGAFLIQGEIEGTAFALTSELFVTAGHVARTLAESSRRGGVNITAPEGSPQSVAVVLDSEEIGSDMALLRVEHLAPESVQWVRYLRWADRTLGALEPVATIGYPYGFYRDAEPIQIVSRAFSGHVVAALKSFKPMERQVGSGLCFSSIESRLYTLYRNGLIPPRNVVRRRRSSWMTLR